MTAGIQLAIPKAIYDAIGAKNTYDMVTKHPDVYAMLDDSPRYGTVTIGDVTYKLVRRKAQKERDYVCGDKQWRVWEFVPVE